MALDLNSFQDPQLDPEYLAYLLDNQASDQAVHYSRLWDYFRNPLHPVTGLAADALNTSSKPYFQAQEAGLPPRITGVRRCGRGDESLTDLRRKEVVIENDIAWRINTSVDFLFGNDINIRSLAPDPDLAEAIETVLAAVFAANGSPGLLQEMALLGSVYGFVDVALRLPADGTGPSLPPMPPATVPPVADSRADSATGRPGSQQTPPSLTATAPEDARKDPGKLASKIPIARVVEFARHLQLETIEAARVLPILDENDYHRVRYWIHKYHKRPARLVSKRRPWLHLPWGRSTAAGPGEVEVVEIIGPSWWQRYEDRSLLDEGPNTLGRIPVVHLQNLALPGSYAGLSDVEPLIPLQDELNTRLSDRANRVTYQSFKMYLGKGIDDFLDRPVGPGQMWATSNLQASIEEFGSDTGSPSEDAHIEQIREALDKVSGVTPLAAGLIKGNIGNLTSGTALRVVLSGLLARTAKKRLTYGAGLKQLAELVLHWLDHCGALRTRPADRRIKVHWPSPLPIDEGDQLRNAQAKAALGLPSEVILRELGYDRDAIKASGA